MWIPERIKVSFTFYLGSMKSTAYHVQGDKMEVLVSVVIPIYQSEKYIKECMDSILTQTYPHIEIIMVNDGSRDGCDRICEKYSEEYANIRVINQVNQGPGIARENGVKEAKGKYLLFVDADDCLDGADTVNKLVARAEKEQADITVGSFCTFCEGKVSEVNYHHLDEVSDTDSVEFRFRGYFQYGHLGFNWGKLYRKEFIVKNLIYSLPYPYIEDKAYNMRCSACKPHYAFVKESVYRYRIKEGEIPFQDKQDFIEVWTGVAKDFENYLEKGKQRETYADLIGFHMFLGVYTLANKLLQDKQVNRGIVRKSLKEYVGNEFAGKYFQELYKGRYVKELDSWVWRGVIHITALVCCLRCYGLLTLGMILLNSLKIDQKVIAKKYGE